MAQTAATGSVAYSKGKTQSHDHQADWALPPDTSWAPSVNTRSAHTAVGRGVSGASAQPASRGEHTGMSPVGAHLFIFIFSILKSAYWGKKLI